ncbi:hypothetical protein [Paenibacillus silagei]|uniref:Uncharacterized protein n=1 Tax=Paenibacillus silagei TaxID=1670801 RepID=A0ABS4NKU6_9BACL|nr:hypothetical protein [Paenibacillus silagei]MBP2110659.1 hypothetical protein [Paenibacillus silagei]
MKNSIKRGKAPVTKKVLSVFMACSLCFGLSSTALASSEFKETITINEDGAVETFIGNYATKSINTSDIENTLTNDFSVDKISPQATYSISNISQPSRWNLFSPVSSYVAYPLSVSAAQGITTTVNASVTGGGGVDIKFLKANIAATIGASVAFTTTQTISYPNSTPGTKGRIVLRYSQNQYTYTITKLGVKYPGSAFTQAYDEYYALQTVSL